MPARACLGLYAVFPLPQRFREYDSFQLFATGFLACNFDLECWKLVEVWTLVSSPNNCIKILHLQSTCSAQRKYFFRYYKTHDSCTHDVCMHGACMYVSCMHDAGLHVAYTYDTYPYDASIYNPWSWRKYTLSMYAWCRYAWCTYGSVSAGREFWLFRVTFFLKVEPSCD